MATSYRKSALFRPSHAAESALLEDEVIRKDRPKSPSRKAVSGFHDAPDRYSFAHLAKVLVSGERLEMLNAVDRLRGRSRVLAELACFSSFQFVRLAAVSHLTNDSEALADVAKYCPYDDTRASAVDELSSDRAYLLDIACSSLFRDTRLKSVELLSDPDTLAKVASRSPNSDSRTAALERISDNPAALRKVSDESPYRRVRLAAMKGLSSHVPALCSLLISSKHPELRKKAALLLSSSVEELDDVDALTEIAKLSPSADVRYLAVGRLWKHHFALRKVVGETRYADARSTALMLLSDAVAHLDDADLLADVAIMSPYGDCRSAAIERLVGQSAALLSVASKSRFKDARSRALDKLKGDVPALKNLVRLSKYSDTRMQAHKMVANPEVFQSELSRILG
jgi:hypothetical protein